MDKKPECKPSPVGLENVADASLTWRHIAPVGITLEHVTDLTYWKNVTRELGQSRVVGRNPFNKIEVIAEDGTWEAVLRVLSVQDGLVRVRVLSHWEAERRPGRKPNLPDGYVVEFIPQNGWRALDPKGGIIAAGEALEDDALRAAASHAKKVAA